MSELSSSFSSPEPAVNLNDLPIVGIVQKYDAALVVDDGQRVAVLVPAKPRTHPMNVVHVDVHGN